MEASLRVSDDDDKSLFFSRVLQNDTNMLSAECARDILMMPHMRFPHRVRVLDVMNGTNQNGTLNTIFHLDPDTLPRWISKELQPWWSDDVAPPGYEARIILGWNHVRGSTDKVFYEPIVFQGPIRFDCSPCVPGQDCPRSIFLIVPHDVRHADLHNDTLIISCLRRVAMPPCF